MVYHVFHSLGFDWFMYDFKKKKITRGREKFIYVCVSMAVMKSNDQSEDIKVIHL